MDVMPSPARPVYVDESRMKLSRAVDGDEIIIRTNHVRLLPCAYHRQGEALIEPPKPNCLELDSNSGGGLHVLVLKCTGPLSF